MSPRAPQQVDIFGDLHDIGPAHERMRLFEPAPRQLEGQLCSLDFSGQAVLETADNPQDNQPER